MKKKTTLNLKSHYVAWTFFDNFRGCPLKPHVCTEVGFEFWGIFVQCLFCQSLCRFCSNLGFIESNSSLIRSAHGPLPQLFFHKLKIQSLLMPQRKHIVIQKSLFFFLFCQCTAIKCTYWLHVSFAFSEVKNSDLVCFHRIFFRIYKRLSMSV